jgi:hypothetical protein
MLGHCIDPQDPTELHSFWRDIYLTAQNFHCDNPKQDTLLRHILYVREYGIANRGRNKIGEEPGFARISNNQTIWSDLPYLIQDFYELWSKDSMNISGIQRRSLSSFVARLASVGVCGNAFTGFALMAFRDALETPRRLTSWDSGHELPIEDLLPALASWLVYASHKLTLLVSQSFNDFEDVKVSSLGELAKQAEVSEPGFNSSRWAFWKKRLNEIIKSDATSEAYYILQMMKDKDHED